MWLILNEAQGNTFYAE